MQPLILAFAEEMTESQSEAPEFHYCEVLNLNVLKTGDCAVGHDSLGTETGTRVARESSDSDKSSSLDIHLLATESFTKASGEGTDSDRNANDN